MNYLKKIAFKESFGKYIFLFLTLILMNNTLAKPTEEKLNLVKDEEIDNKLNNLFPECN